MKKKEQSKAESVQPERTKSNPTIDKIISDYPESIIACPRGAFEEQLRKHLIKHKVGEKQ